MKRLALVATFFVSIFFITLAYPEDIPETIVLESLTNIYEPVEFSHGEHVDIADECAACHHHSEEGTPSCKKCHEPITIYRYKGAQRKTGLGLKGAYHGLCMGCHKESESGPLGCTDCHTKKAKR
ncbi:MAG: hypothetical protein DRG50_08435 [Deltaproteobacteria bacterium]|nr:MAG: hypothetical protein DRG50_08435 [Deltaproteobacteria bacterium]